MNTEPLPGETRLKAWLIDESLRTGLSPDGVYRRMERGRYRNVKRRKVNHHTVFVRVGEGRGK